MTSPAARFTRESADRSPKGAGHPANIRGRTLTVPGKSLRIHCEIAHRLRGDRGLSQNRVLEARGYGDDLLTDHVEGSDAGHACDAAVSDREAESGKIVE